MTENNILTEGWHQRLESRLEALEKELSDLKATLDLFFDSRDQDQFIAWRRAKRAAASGEAQQSTDAIVGRNLPAAPIKTLTNGIGL